MFFICCSQEDKYANITDKYKTLIEEKRWKEAEELTDKVIKEYPRSIYMEKYYETMRQILIEEYNEIILADRKANPPDPESIPRGSITLTLSEDLGPEAKRILEKELYIKKKYLKEFPNGRFRNNFRYSLMGTYRLLGMEKEAERLALEFYNSNNLNDKLSGVWTLAMYAQAKRQYKEAIEYHKFIVDNKKDLIEKIKHTYYISICYYELGNLEQAKNYLNRVFELSNNTPNKHVEKVARITWDFIKEYEANPQIEKRHFVFFKGVGDR